MVLRMIREIILAKKLKRAASEGSSGEVCVACDSKDVTVLAPQAYRCNLCGHEGGDGYGQYKKQLRHASFERLSPEERRKGAQTDLMEARRLLLSAIGDLRNALVSSGFDMAGLGGGFGTGEGNEKQSAMTSAMGFMLEAQNRAEDAKAKMKLYLETDMASTEEMGSYTAWSADLYFDNIFTDLNVHSKITRAQQEANRMVAVIEKTLLEEFGVTFNDDA